MRPACTLNRHPVKTVQNGKTIPPTRSAAGKWH